MSIFDLTGPLEVILKQALVPLLKLIEQELINSGVVSEETLQQYHDHIMLIMKVLQPFLLIARRIIQVSNPQLLVVFDWAQELYSLWSSDNSST